MLSMNFRLRYAYLRQPHLLDTFRLVLAPASRTARAAFRKIVTNLRIASFKGANEKLFKRSRLLSVNGVNQ